MVCTRNRLIAGCTEYVFHGLTFYPVGIVDKGYLEGCGGSGLQKVSNISTGLIIIISFYILYSGVWIVEVEDYGPRGNPRRSTSYKADRLEGFGGTGDPLGSVHTYSVNELREKGLILLEVENWFDQRMAGVGGWVRSRGKHRI